MSYSPEHAYPMFAADAAADARAVFIRNTYVHLGGAILTFAGLEAIIFNTPELRDRILSLMMGNWWVALIAFMVVSWVADYWARSGSSQLMQYTGLMLYTVAEAVLFVPLLWVAQNVGGPDSNIIGTAGLLTMVVFGGLTAIVFLTKADFSFLRMALFLGGLGAMGLVLCSAMFGFGLPLIFTVGMIVLAAGYILYDTSNILHHYRTDQHVAAALALFASVALLFWELLILLIRLQGDD